ncbi:ankyrin repeat-containing domain protein [Nemania sp. FL0916]|nr:ankyrin repeat-containing domain protein [Nemania sp. FL0916]
MTSIHEEIIQKAEGIFLWVVLVVAMLNKAYDDGRDEAAQAVLEEVPSDLEGVFNQLLEKADPHKAELVRMLQWVLFSEYHLAPEELFIASVGRFLPPRETIDRRIVSSSKGLIEIRHGHRDYVQFIHLSVKDFLCRNNRLQKLDPTLKPYPLSASYARLWAFCWSCIEQLYLTTTIPKDTQQFIDKHIFLGHALGLVLHYADKALPKDERGGDLEAAIAWWLCENNGWFQWWKALRSLQLVDDPVYKEDELVYTLAIFNYKNLAELALKKGVNVEARGYDGTALWGASARGHYEIAKLLLEYGADVNAQYGYPMTALQIACLDGQYKLIKLLLEYGAKVDTPYGYYGTALQTASAQGHHEIVRLLLKFRAHVDIPTGYHGTALSAPHE